MRDYTDNWIGLDINFMRFVYKEELTYEKDANLFIKK